MVGSSPYLSQREAAVTLGLGLISPTATLVAALESTDVDFLAFDCQHSPHSEATVAELLTQLRGSRLSIMVRVSNNAPALIGKILDAGADAVVVPMVSTPEQARAAVAATRFSPNGVRSFGPFRADLPRDPGLLEDRSECFVMIETAQGLASAQDICAVEGVAGVLVGPADLAIDLGLPGLQSLTAGLLDDSLAQIRSACDTSGIAMGAYASDPRTSGHMIAAGCRIVVIGTDGAMLSRALTTELAVIRGEVS